MTDIPSLIERLRSKATDCHVSEQALYVEAAEALSLTVPEHLSKARLPDEIGRLIERLRNYHSRTGAYAPSATCRHGVHPYDCREGCAPVTFEAADVFYLVAALERMARENERLLERIRELYLAQKSQILSARSFEPDYTALQARIRGLEAEIRQWKITAAAEAEGNREHRLGWEKAEAERDEWKRRANYAAELLEMRTDAIKAKTIDG